MYCKHCGKEINENSTFCSHCGKNVAENFSTQKNQESKTEKQKEKLKRPEAPVTFGKAVNNYFVKIFDFNGRSVRSEYWWIFLLNTPIGLIFNFLIYNPTNYILTTTAWCFYIVYLLVSCIAGTSLMVRRLHDIGKTGNWFFITFIPFIGTIILYIMLAQDSVGDNQWGLSYYGPPVEIENTDEYTDAYQKALENADHKWRCDCGKMIFTIPCPFCGRVADNIAKQNKEIKIEDGFKKCKGCGATIPLYAEECVCGCKIFQDHI